MRIRQNVNMDLNRPRKHMIHVGQVDNTREINLTLNADGMPYDMTYDLAALGIQDGDDDDIIKTVKYIKADGKTSGEYSVISTGEPAVVLQDGSTNEYTVSLDEHVTDIPGFAEIFVTFYVSVDDKLYVLHSFPITVEIARNTTSEIDPGQPYYNGTPFLLKSSQAAKTSGMTQAVGVDANGKLWTTPGGGGSGGSGVEKKTITITLSGTTYSSDTPYADIATAVENGNIVEADTPDGIARYEGKDGNNYIFSVNSDIGDRVYIIRYGIGSSDAVGRTAYAVDNSMIPQVTVATKTDSTYTILPVANFQYIFSNPVISLTINSGYAATGAWSIEFDAPSNVAPSVTIPSGLKTIPASPSFSANKHYEINCHNGYAVIAEW